MARLFTMLLMALAWPIFAHAQLLWYENGGIDGDFLTETGQMVTHGYGEPGTVKLVLHSFDGRTWNAVSEASIILPSPMETYGQIRYQEEDGLLLVRTGGSSARQASFSSFDLSQGTLVPVGYRDLSFLEGIFPGYDAGRHFLFDGRIFLYAYSTYGGGSKIVVMSAGESGLPVTREFTVPEFMQVGSPMAVLDGPDSPIYLTGLTETNFTQINGLWYSRVTLHLLDGNGALIQTLDPVLLPGLSHDILVSPDHNGVLLFSLSHPNLENSAVWIGLKDGMLGEPVGAMLSHSPDLIHPEAFHPHTAAWIQGRTASHLVYSPGEGDFPWSVETFQSPFNGYPNPSEDLLVSPDSIRFFGRSGMAVYRTADNAYDTLPWFDGVTPAGNTLEIPWFGKFEFLPTVDSRKLVAYHQEWGLMWIAGHNPAGFWAYIPDGGWFYFSNQWHQQSTNTRFAWSHDIGKFVFLQSGGEHVVFYDYTWQEWLGITEAPKMNFNDLLPVFDESTEIQPGFSLSIDYMGFSMSGTDVIDGESVEVVIHGKHFYTPDQLYNSVGHWMWELWRVEITTPDGTADTNPEILWNEFNIEFPAKFHFDLFFRQPDRGLYHMKIEYNSGRVEEFDKGWFE